MEQRGRRVEQFGRRSCAGEHVQRRSGSVYGAGMIQRAREREEGSRRTAGSPEAKRAGRSGAGSSGTAAKVLDVRRPASKKARSIRAIGGLLARTA